LSPRTYPTARRCARSRPTTQLRAASRWELHRSLRDSAFWGVQVANIHLLSEPGVIFARAKPDLAAIYRELGDAAQRLGLRLAIETTRPYRCDEYLELVRAIGHASVGGTVDTGHLHFFRAELPVIGVDRATPEGIKRYNDFMIETLTALGPKLFHVHFNDLRVADWPRLFGHLARSNYRGALVAELLYYQGAADTGAMLTRAFTHRTPEGSARRGLEEMNAFLGSFFV
jgi:sugar phosphate isomerase/epimerase